MTLAIDARKALRDFQFDVRLEVPAGVTVVLGPSGSGKTTLLRIVAGLVRPDAGTIVLDGRVLGDARTFVPPHARGIGMVFQEYALFPHLDVIANVAFGLRARRVPPAERARRARRMLDRLEIGDLGGERPGDLSGGQRQRVALARALVVEPAALLLDEPLSALDPATRGRVRDELRAMLAAAARVPTLLVTHDADDRGAFPDRVVAIDGGRLR